MKKTKQKTWSAQQIRMLNPVSLCKMREQGLTHREMARKIGVNRTIISERLKLHNIK